MELLALPQIQAHTAPFIEDDSVFLASNGFEEGPSPLACFFLRRVFQQHKSPGKGIGSKEDGIGNWLNQQ